MIVRQDDIVAGTRGPALQSIIRGRLRAAVAGLWVAAIAIAALTAWRAWSRLGAGRALPYLAVVGGGIALTAAVLKGNRIALGVSTALLGAQILGALGSAWQLANGVDGSKAAELRDLGFEPRFGVALNLAYSTIASAVFVWVALRWWAVRRFTRDDDDHAF